MPRRIRPSIKGLSTKGLSATGTSIESVKSVKFVKG